MRSLVFIAAAVAATPALAAELTSQRLQNAAAEPQNWLMVHRDYNNSRHSPLTRGQPRHGEEPAAQVHVLDRRHARPAAPCAARKNRRRSSTTASCTCPTPGPGDEVRRAQRHRGRAAVALRSQDHARPHHPRARDVRQQDLPLDLRRARDRAQPRHRRGRLGDARPPRRWIPRPARRRKTQAFSGAPLAIKTARRQGARLAGREHRRLAGHAKLGRRLGRRHRQAGLAHLHHPGAGRARLRDLEGQPQCLAHRRRRASGRPPPTIRPPISSITAPATRSRPSIRNFGPATISTPRARIALDADTGKMAWYFQETPNEHWDFDTPSPKMLYDVTGQRRDAQGRRQFLAQRLLLHARPRQRPVPARRPVPGESDLDQGHRSRRPASRSITIRAATCSATPALGQLRGKPGQESCPWYSGSPTFFPPTFDAKRHDRLRRPAPRAAPAALSMKNADGREQGLGRACACAARSRAAPPPTARSGRSMCAPAKVIGKAQFPIPNESGMLGTDGDLVVHRPFDRAPRRLRRRHAARKSGASASARRSRRRR